jgi:hypothetical protein
MAISPKALSYAAILAASAVIAAAPATAQDKGGDRVNMVIAYDENECPEQTDEGEIVICQILVEAERYRIPSNLRSSDSPNNSARIKQVEKLKYVGDFGTMSCSPTGAGGFTGCTQKFIEAAYKDKEESETIRFTQLIEKARQERLSTIDEDAAAEQKRVEAIEREYLERLERERSAPLPGEVEVRDAAPDSLATPPGASETPETAPAAPKEPVVGPVLTEEGSGN